MLRKALFVLAAVLAISALAAICSAQEYRVPVYSVNGRVILVNRGLCETEVTPFTYAQSICHDWIEVQYYAPDRRLRQGWIETFSLNGARRPYPGDRLTCDIDARTYELVDVDGWYRPTNIRIYFGYSPPYHRHFWTPRHRHHRGPFTNPRPRIGPPPHQGPGYGPGYPPPGYVPPPPPRYKPDQNQQPGQQPPTYTPPQPPRQKPDQIQPPAQRPPRPADKPKRPADKPRHPEGSGQKDKH